MDPLKLKCMLYSQSRHIIHHWNVMSAVHCDDNIWISSVCCQREKCNYWNTYYNYCWRNMYIYRYGVHFAGLLDVQNTGIYRQTEVHSFGDHLISESVSVKPSSVTEASIMLCSVSLWLVWVNVQSACALNTRYITHTCNFSVYVHFKVWIVWLNWLTSRLEGHFRLTVLPTLGDT
jgi:hypothetical protein